MKRCVIVYSYGSIDSTELARLMDFLVNENIKYIMIEVRTGSVFQIYNIDKLAEIDLDGIKEIVAENA